VAHPLALRIRALYATLRVPESVRALAGRLRALAPRVGGWLLREARPEPTPLDRPAAAAWALPVLVALVGFWGTAVSTSNARVGALWTVEPYAMATYEQMVYNIAHFGRFVQTIHSGYDDDWSWSGHRSLVLLLTALPYRLFDSPYGLATIQIGYVALGVLPAALLGRRAYGGEAGLAIGGLLYLASPAVMALALQDYQDLVAALPALVGAAACFSARHPGWAVLGAVLGVAPREETVAVTVALAALVLPPGGWRRWAANVGAAGLVAAVTTGVSVLYERAHTLPAHMRPHDMPMVNARQEAVDALLSGTLPGLDCSPFYLLALAPLALLGLLAPVYELLGLAFLLLHLTVEPDNGVDRDWFGHAHHMAPAVAFLVLARLQGTARLLRWLAGARPAEGGATTRWRRVRVALVAAVALLGAGHAARAWLDWAQEFRLVRAWLPTMPERFHPAWHLAAALPADAVPAVALDASLTVSARGRSYTYAESVADKARRLGLGVATHLIAPSGDTVVREWAEKMPGFEVIEEREGWILARWDPDSVDPTRPAPDRDAFPRVRRWGAPTPQTPPPPGVPLPLMCGDISPSGPDPR